MIEHYQNFHDLNKHFYEKEPRPENFNHWFAMEGDYAVLASLIHKHKVKTVFEIGAWEGYTSAMMLNLPTIEYIKAIDVNNTFDVPNIGNPTHNLSDPKVYGKYAKKHAKLLNKKYELVFCDSKLYKSDEHFDLVFIDGDHSYEYVKLDTELALKMKPKVIVWHDYPNEEGVRQYIEDLKNKGLDIHIHNLKQDGGALLATLEL